MEQEQKPSVENPSTNVETKDVVEEKPAVESKEVADTKVPEAPVDESKALVAVEAEKKEPIIEKRKEGSVDRDAILTKVNTEKRDALIKAWEENEKAKAENKYYKSVSNVTAWENTKKSSAETRLRRKEEKLEKMKAAYVEKMKNEIAVIHRQAEEKRAMAEAKRGEEMLKAEETAAKYKAQGGIPKKFLACFGA